jgi:transcription antitermination factor NusG
MNERIKQLSEQAEKYTDDNFKGEPVWTEVYEQKFAELIIRECISALDYADGSVHHSECLLEHFGVDDVSIKVGSRIKVISGFSVGAKGTVNYIDPSGKMWVRRDGASSDVFYHPEEVIGVE